MKWGWTVWRTFDSGLESSAMSFHLLQRSAWMSLSPVEDWDASEGGAPLQWAALWRVQSINLLPVSCVTHHALPHILALSSGPAPPAHPRPPSLPSNVGGSTQRCLPFMVWSLEVIAEVMKRVPQQQFSSVPAGGDRQQNGQSWRRLLQSTLLKHVPLLLIELLAL